jgi:hypothetical protein
VRPVGLAVHHQDAGGLHQQRLQPVRLDWLRKNEIEARLVAPLAVGRVGVTRHGHHQRDRGPQLAGQGVAVYFTRHGRVHEGDVGVVQ